MEYLFYALMGIALLIVCELIVFMIIDWIREWIESNSNRIHIKMVKTGNKYFHLHTIDDVKGVTSFPEIRSQILVFRSITQSIVIKILQYQLDDYYVLQKRLQLDIDDFCANIKQFDKFLQTIEFDHLQENPETTASARQATKALIEKNQTIVTYFVNLAEHLDEIAKKESDTLQ